MPLSWFLNVVVEHDSSIEPQRVISEALSYVDINRQEVVKLYNSKTAARIEIPCKDKWMNIEKNASFLMSFMYKKYIQCLRLFDVSQGKPFTYDTLRMEDVCYEGLHAMSKMHFGDSKMSGSPNENACTCPICYEKQDNQLILNCGHCLCAVCCSKMRGRTTCPICIKEIQYSKRIFFTV